MISAGGEVIARGSAGGGPVKVPEGEYRVSLNLADGPHVIGGVKIEYGLTTEVRLMKKGDEIAALAGKPEKAPHETGETAKN